MVLDGEPGEKFRNVDGPMFSPDSRHFAYVGWALTTMSLMLDGGEIYRAKNFVNDSLTFDGPSSLHVLTIADHQFVRVRFDLTLEAKQR